MVVRNTRKSPRARKQVVMQPASSEDSGSESSFNDESASEIDSIESDDESQILDSRPAEIKRRRLEPVMIVDTLQTSGEPSISNNVSEIAESEPESCQENIDKLLNADGEVITTQTVTKRQPKPKQPKKPKVILEDVHPRLKGFWDEVKKEVVRDIPGAEQPKDLLVNLLPFQKQGLYWLQAQEDSSYRGGILADEMGMGKTIQVISLLVSKPSSKPNLILVPPVALLQWKSEIATKATPGLFKVIIYHGNNREVSKKTLEQADIVLSTYSILEHSFRKEYYGTKRKGEMVKAPSLLHSIDWGRIILDEAHAIKDRYCSTARAAFALKSDYKWSMSGTPMQNRIGELFSLVRFMNLYPHSYYFCSQCPCESQTWLFKDSRKCLQCDHTGHQHFNWWNREILKPIQKYGSVGQGLDSFEKLGVILDRIMLRRTKVERNDELGLPPRVVETRRDYFNDAEEELYESLYTDTQRTYQVYASHGTVLNNYASIFSLLSRMRLAANHPDLVTKTIEAKNTKLVCTICHEEAEDPIVSKCKHVFCREDARQYIESVPVGDSLKCPHCLKALVIDLSQPEMEKSQAQSQNVQKSIVNYLDLENWRSSTKIEALVEELSKLKSEDSTTKSIVFSQFVSFLDLIHWRLSRSGFNVIKLDGRMGPPQRAEVIDRFNTDPSLSVFLISLKAGGVALNLTEASRVFVMDPWWNPAVEDQAMDRIHRLGQHRPIKITRMVIENSIESRIIELQAKKKAMFDSTVGKDMSSLARLTEDDFQFLFVL